MQKNICLLYLADKLPVDIQKAFFSSMCNAIGYDEDKSHGLSCIFSQFGLFAGQRIAKDEMSTLLKKNKCSSCKTLVRRTRYSALDVSRNACQLCSLSPSFQGARERDEMIVLKGLLTTERDCLSQILYPSHSFRSMKRMSEESSLGSFPILPFYERLFAFLQDDVENFTSMEALCSAFLNALAKYASEYCTEGYDLAPFQRAATTYLNDVLRTPPPGRDAFFTSLAALNASYDYQPPAEAKIIKDEAMMPNPSQSLEPANEPEKTNDASGNVSPAPDDEAQFPSTEQIPVDSGKADMPKRRIPILRNNVCMFGLMVHGLTPAFLKKIVRVDDGSIFSFISSILKSRWVGIEKCHMHHNDGLLLYVESNTSYFFYDFSLFGANPIREYVLSPPILALSAHALDVGSFLYLNGCDAMRLNSLDVLCRLGGRKDSFNDAASLISPPAGLATSRKECLVSYLMSQYGDIYNANKILLDQAGTFSSYCSCMRLYNLLYATYDLSHLVYDLPFGFDEHGFLDLEFHFSRQTNINRVGTVYHISIKELDEGSHIALDSFAFDIICACSKIPAIYQRKGNFLGKRGNTISIFLSGPLESSIPMYEIYLDQIRYLFAKRFSRILHVSVSYDTFQ